MTGTKRPKAALWISGIVILLVVLGACSGAPQSVGAAPVNGAYSLDQESHYAQVPGQQGQQQGYVAGQPPASGVGEFTNEQTGVLQDGDFTDASTEPQQGRVILKTASVSLVV